MELIYGSYFIIAAASFFIYILPMMVAFYRRHENYTAIFLINLLLGWTGIVWVVCLVWAFVGSAKRYNVVNSGSSGPSKYEELERISELKRKGDLTAEEFEREKSRLLG